MTNDWTSTATDQVQKDFVKQYAIMATEFGRYHNHRQRQMNAYNLSINTEPDESREYRITYTRAELDTFTTEYKSSHFQTWSRFLQKMDVRYRCVVHVHTLNASARSLPTVGVACALPVHCCATGSRQKFTVFARYRVSIPQPVSDLCAHEHSTGASASARPSPVLPWHLS